jgi:hypothetical protein
VSAQTGSSFPTVKFVIVHADQNPPSYSVAVDSIGNARYESMPSSVEQSGEPYALEFNMSSASKDQIFTALASLNFLRDGVPDQATRSPSIKTLTYINGQDRTQATYHASSNSTVQQLTTLYRNISNTLEFGRRLDRMHQSGSSDLEGELNQMEEAGRAGRLVETSAVYPVLRSIVNDAKVSQAARQKAKAIISMPAPTSKAIINGPGESPERQPPTSPSRQPLSSSRRRITRFPLAYRS